MPGSATVPDRAGGAVQDTPPVASQPTPSSEGDRGAGADEASEKLKQQVANVEKERDRAKSNLDKAVARAEKAEKRAQQVQDEFLSKVADAAVSSGRPQDGPTLEQLQRARQDMAKKLEDADGETLLDTIDRYSMDAADRKTKEALASLRKEVEAREKERDDKWGAMDAEIARLRQVQADRTPEFANRQKELQAIADEEGLDLSDPKQRAVAMQIDRREQKLRETLAPERETPPGSSAATRVTEPAGEAEVPAHVIKHWQKRGYSEEEMKKLEAEWKAGRKK